MPTSLSLLVLLFGSASYFKSAAAFSLSPLSARASVRTSRSQRPGQISGTTSFLLAAPLSSASASPTGGWTRPRARRTSAHTMTMRTGASPSRFLSSAMRKLRSPPCSLQDKSSSGRTRSERAVASPSTRLAALPAAIQGAFSSLTPLGQQAAQSGVVNTVLGSLLAVTGKYKSSLTKAGLAHSYLLGVVLWACLGWQGWATCLAYLIFGSAVTKVRMAEKEAKGIAEGRGGRRGPENVWGSAATAAMCALAAVWYGGAWQQVYAHSANAGYVALAKLGFVSSLATKLSDTFASEIGKAYGKSTFLITTLRSVPPGTEGAVSLEGTLAGVVGSVIIAMFGVGVGLISGRKDVLVTMLAAFVATNIESLLGATVQGKKGLEWVSNELINFINTLCGAVVAIVVTIALRG